MANVNRQARTAEQILESGDAFVTTTEAAIVLHAGYKWVVKEFDRGVIPGYLIGNKRLVSMAWLKKMAGKEAA